MIKSSQQLTTSDIEALWGTLNGLSGRSKKEVGSRLQEFMLSGI